MVEEAFEEDEHAQGAGIDHTGALQTGKQALRELDYHPFTAEKLAAAFDSAEMTGREALYEAWLQKDEGERYSGSFRSVFIELEEALGRVMSHDRDDRHARTERGWTPPPKHYTDRLGDS
jgi:hypothetical protein